MRTWMGDWLSIHFIVRLFSLAARISWNWILPLRCVAQVDEYMLILLHIFYLTMLIILIIKIFVPDKL
jgi:hypothetical protein